MRAPEGSGAGTTPAGFTQLPLAAQEAPGAQPVSGLVEKVNCDAALLALKQPGSVVTTTLTLPVPGGATARIEVGETTVNEVALIPPKVTAVTPVKLIPVMATVVPPTVGPELGLRPETTGWPP